MAWEYAAAVLMGPVGMACMSLALDAALRRRDC
jgi:hypothetical protein